MTGEKNPRRALAMATDLGDVSLTVGVNTFLRS